MLYEEVPANKEVADRKKAQRQQKRQQSRNEDEAEQQVIDHLGR